VASCGFLNRNEFVNQIFGGRRKELLHDSEARLPVEVATRVTVVERTR
jgi:hypothetical protein